MHFFYKTNMETPYQRQRGKGLGVLDWDVSHTACLVGCPGPLSVETEDSGLQEIPVSTPEEKLCFPSGRDLTPRVSLECNPEFLSHLERKTRSWTQA